MSWITPRCSENGDSFIRKVYEFLQTAISTLELMEGHTKKQLNLKLDYIVSTAWLAVQKLSSKADFDVIKGVTREAKPMFNPQHVPKDMVRDYEVLQRLLEAASNKLADIEPRCESLLGEVSGTLFNTTTVHLLKKLKRNHTFTGASAGHVILKSSVKHYLGLFLPGTELPVN